MRKLLIFFMCLIPTLVRAQTHPSVLLTPGTLTALSAKVVANEASWVTLKAKCDQYLGGTVYPPDHVGVSSPNIASGYQGDDYRKFTMDYGLCYQALLQTDPTGAAPYGAKLVAIIAAMSDPAHQLAAGTQQDVIAQNSGYDIRDYGPALAMGFDWSYSLLTSGQKTQIINQINKWVDSWRTGSYPVVISGGAITSITVNDHGIHFASPPTATIHKSAGVPGTGATLGTPALDGNGNITSIAVTAGGSSYDASNPPEVYLNSVSRTTFQASHPATNYYIGYYLAECLAALATQVDNPNAALYWTDWSTRVHGEGVGAWEGTYLKGGGWQEGFGNYGELVVKSANLSTMAVNDVKGINLTTTGTPNFTWPTDTIDYLMYASWPSQWSLIDEGSGYCKSAGCGLNINGDMNMQHPDIYRALSFYGKYWSHPHAAMIHKFAKDVYTATVGHYPLVVPNNLMPDHEWEDFLYWFPSDPDADYTTLPLSYKASGIQEIFARSDWSTSALWLMIHNSSYIEAPPQAEQEFGTGQMEIVNGSTPFIVIPMGWSMHLPDGDAGKTHGLCDEVGGCAADPAHNTLGGRPRRWYNTFQVATWDHSQVDLNEWSGANALPPLPASGISPLTTLNGGQTVGGTNTTTISAFEDTATYLFSTAAHLESMMRLWLAAGTAAPITAWNRQEVYLRGSNQVLVYDRTTVDANNNRDQVVAFHTPALPSVVAQSPVVSGITRSDVNFSPGFSGSIISILPASAAVTSWDLDNGSTVWRTEIRNTTCTSTSCPTPAPTSQKWLTVLDANSSAGAVYNASNITSAGWTGALLKAPSGLANSIVMFNTGAAGTTVAVPQTYTIPLSIASTHVLTEVAVSTVYKVSYNTGTGVVTIANSGGTGTAITSSAAGALNFTIDSSGAINGAAPPAVPGISMGNGATISNGASIQ